LIASVIILKLAAIQVAGWSELADLFFTHLLASCLQRSTIQLANLFKSLFVSLLLKIFGFVWIRKSAKTNDFTRIADWRHNGSSLYLHDKKNRHTDSCTDAKKRGYERRDGLRVKFNCNLGQLYDLRVEVKGKCIYLRMTRESVFI